MSFNRLDIKDNNKIEGRSCIILCNIGGKELQKIKTCSMLLGITDIIALYSKNGDAIISDVLENNISSECSDGRKEKAVIFNAITPKKVNIFIENLKKAKLNNILKAVVTETSINWTINTLIENLEMERRAFKEGDTTELHK